MLKDRQKQDQLHSIGLGAGTTETEVFRTVKLALSRQFANFLEYRHSMRTAIYAYPLAKELGASEQEAVDAAVNAFFHDLGKEHPDLIEQYRSREVRWTVEKVMFMNHEHQKKGPVQLECYDLGDLERIRRSSEFVQRHHHKRVSEIPASSEQARVHLTRVVDWYDAMTCNQQERSYRRLLEYNPIQAAKELLIGSRTKILDEKTTRVFISRVLELNPNFGRRSFVV